MNSPSEFPAATGHPQDPSVNLTAIDAQKGIKLETLEKILQILLQGVQRERDAWMGNLDR